MSPAPVTVTNFYVHSRSAATVNLGLFASERERLGAMAISIRSPELARTLEIGSTLKIADWRVETTGRRNGSAQMLIPERAEIVPFQGWRSAKIDGLNSATCKRLAQLFGPEFFKAVAASPSLLDATRYSREKRALIVAVCETEAGTDASTADDARCVIETLVWAGLGRTQARSLAEEFEPAALKRDPYAPLFGGRLSFLRADRFAHRFTPAMAAKHRPRALIMAALDALADERGNTLVSEDALYARAWLNYAMTRADFDEALATLRAKGLVRFIGKPAPAPVAEATPWREIPPLEDEARPDAAAYGLARLIEAERFISDRAGKNETSRLTGARAETVEKIIAAAPKLCGFTLDKDQARALRAIFANKYSIITGPPGSGKTAIIALANLVAVEIYGGKHETPIRGVALAGRAASTLANAASIGGVKFEASTVHRAFGLKPDADDKDGELKAKREISSGVLVIDETSMINAHLLALMLRATQAEHVVFVGDVEQLPPIGPAAPFADMIARGLVPGTRLKGAYRTDDEDIRDLLAYVRNGAGGRRGGCEFIPAPQAERGAIAGQRWRKLIGDGVDPHEIAIITPHNNGEDGTRALNRDIRRALNMPDSITVGDMIMATKNDYRAVLADNDATTEIFNGERAIVVNVGDDFIDAKFPTTARNQTRIVRPLSDGELPEHFAFGYAMTAHKSQGSQFAHVVIVTSPRAHFQSRSSIYTAASRARRTLTIVGDESELERVAAKAERRRSTYLGRGGE
jgi:AAA domain/UvrD-like helicase C-terminal domain